MLEKSLLLNDKKSTLPNSVGVYLFLDKNKEKVQGSVINGLAPSISTIADGSYEVSRPLYFYIKQEQVGVIPGLQEFGDYFMSLATSESPLEDAGLIPKP